MLLNFKMIIMGNIDIAQFAPSLRAIHCFTAINWQEGNLCEDLS